MNNFTFYNPTHFVFGQDAELALGQEMIKLNLTATLIVLGQGSAKRSGLLSRVEASLTQAGIRYQVLEGVVPNPLDDKVYEGIALTREHKLQSVLGLGGASALDTAKAIAVGALYDGDFWDFYSGKAQVKQALPILSIPTIAAAGSESSNSSVITKASLPLKRGIRSEAIRPVLALMNPRLTFTVPNHQKANGICDMMAHIFERYFTNTKEVSLSDEMCEGVLRAIMPAGARAMQNSADYDAHADLMWAGCLAHNDTLSPGREQDWSTHGIGHALSARFGAAHGAVLAVLFPHWMQHQMHHDVARFARFAHKVMGVAPSGDAERDAKDGIIRLRQYFDSLSLPRSLRDFGVAQSDLDSLVKDVGYNAKGVIGFFNPLTPQDVSAIYQSALSGTLFGKESL